MRLALLILATLQSAHAYQQFEARQQHPITLSPDGTRLLALHSPASSLSVFDVSNPLRSAPLLIAEIPVGIEPVTVRMRTDDEAWVVNEVSDSVSIVSLSARAVIATLRVSDEPADVCFANGKAFVSCARNQQVVVFNASTRSKIATIPVPGISPRALTASADGSTLYLACLLSGNRTTVIPSSVAPAQPAPTNPALPAAPDTALIVAASDPRVSWNVLDHDIAEIDTTSHTITRWFSDVGNNLFDLAVHPDGSLWCPNSDATNLTRFEPALNGGFASHRLTRIDPVTSAMTHHDLNPGIVQQTTPDSASIAIALSQPTAITFNSDGSRAWVAAFNSDRVAEIDTATGDILNRVNVRVPNANSTAMRGPRALALSANGSQLFILNKISDTLTTATTSTGDILSEIKLGSIDPMPAAIRQGRGIIYDARLSGNGTVSCATCHIDADRDGLAWDLGNPGGEMVFIDGADLAIHDLTVKTRSIHPMKGPLITQPLRGLALNDSTVTQPAEATVTKFHWRGDKPSLQDFNSTFPNLMGGNLRSAAHMDLMDGYLRSIINHPNPNRRDDNSLKSNVNGGNANTGRTLFLNHIKSHCALCHTLPGGTDQNIDDRFNVGQTQPMKNPPLRLTYQRANLFDPTPTADSLAGFGLGADGTGHLLPKVHPYSLDILNSTELADVTAFILSFDTGTAPSVGMDLAINSTTPALESGYHFDTLEARADYGECGLIATGTLSGVRRSFRWDSGTQRYLSDKSNEPARTRAELLALLAPGDALNVTGVLVEDSLRLGGDRDLNGILDQDEALPALSIESTVPTPTLRWTTSADFYPESNTTLSGPWLPWTEDSTASNPFTESTIPTNSGPTRFFRLRRTW